MDNKTVITWVAGIVARGVAWVLAAKVGMDAATADSTAATVGQALVALALVGLSIYTSIKGRKALLNATPPVTP
jgi:hypothetical protein